MQRLYKGAENPNRCVYCYSDPILEGRNEIAEKGVMLLPPN